MERRLALIRGINVGGRMLPMAALRALCEGLGWREVRTYIASGNVLFEADGAREDQEAALEAAIAARFPFQVPVIVRTASQWAGIPDTNPFKDAARDAPNRLLLFVSKRSPPDEAEARLQQRATIGERVRQVGDLVWIHFPDGIAQSKLSPTLIDKMFESPATSRNYRTVVKLKEMLET